MSELSALYARLATQPADRRRLVLAKLRADGWPVPLEVRAPADSVGTMPPLEPECYLAADIRPERPYTAFPSEPRGVLLTGATGFVGAFLLEVLLRRTRAKIYCLVRSSDYFIFFIALCNESNFFALRCGATRCCNGQT